MTPFPISRRHPARRRSLRVFNDSASAVLESLEERVLLSSVSGTADAAQTPANEAPDLVAFAQTLSDAGVTLYGAEWHAACTEQRELFGDGIRVLPFVDVTNPDRSPNDVAVDQGITDYPTWVFPDGTRAIGVQSLETIAQRSGVAIPMSNRPTFAPLQDVTLLSGSPLHIPLDGYDPNGEPLTYTVTSSDPTVDARVLQENRSFRISVAGYGDMVFELFEGRTSRATERLVELSDSSFYHGVIFHRVIDGFVIQGGDPTGTGSGGSSLPDFDDDFNVELQHNTAGILSWAKSADDTNNSQFFVTEAPQRHLDFNHSVAGIQTEGAWVREAISRTDTDASGRPSVDVVIDSTEIFEDDENAVIMLSAPEGTTGSSTVTVTVTDSAGHAYQQSFHVDVQPDSVDGNPFLADIPRIATTMNESVSFQLEAIDVEGDPAVFLDENTLYANNIPFPVVSNADLDYGVDFDTGHVTVTPKNDLIGVYPITVATAYSAYAIDYQVVPISIGWKVTSQDFPSSNRPNDGTDDVFRIVRNGDNVEVWVNETLVKSLDAAVVPHIVIDGSQDNDRLIVDYSGGDPIPFEGLYFNAGGQTNAAGDSLTLTGGTIDTATYSIQNAASGTIDLDGGTIVYSGLEPMSDQLTVQDRVFQFGSDANRVTLGDDALSGNGISRLVRSASGPAVDFTNPVRSLVIDTGAGNDAISLTGIDSAFAAVLTARGASGADQMDATGLTHAIVLEGGDGADSLTGGEGRDVLRGGAGDDTLVLTGTDATLFGGAGHDVVHTQGDRDFSLSDSAIVGSGTTTLNSVESAVITGGSGHNTLDASGFTGTATLQGQNGNDVLIGGNGNDCLLGGRGNDTLNGRSGDDWLVGESGNDNLFGGNGNDTLSGGVGRDYLNGQAKEDTVIERANVDFVLTDAKLTGQGDDRLKNTEHAELTGGTGGNKLDARAFSGTVLLHGRDGNDTLIGGRNADTLYGDGGDDLMFGGGGRDSIVGGDGDDTLRGQGSSYDYLTGGAGNDRLDGGSGMDMVIESGDTNFALTDTSLSGVGSDVLNSVEFARLTAGDSDNLLNAQGFSGNAYMFGGAGEDTLLGGAGNDRLSGDAGNDSIYGASGTDWLYGRAGDDWLAGEDGLDYLYGQDGNDSLSGGPGDDRIRGAAGIDQLWEFTDGDLILTNSQLVGLGTDRIYLVESAELHGSPGSNRFDAQRFSGSVSLIGGDGEDCLLGGSGNDRIDAGAGNDTVDGGDGDDVITGGTQNDSLIGGLGHDTLLGDFGRDTLRGGDGRDGLDGGADADLLDGGRDDDTLAGSVGNDTIFGGAGNDIAMGQSGDDSVNGQGGNADTLSGGTGTDVVVGTDAEIDESFIFSAEWMTTV